MKSIKIKIIGLACLGIITVSLCLSQPVFARRVKDTAGETKQAVRLTAEESRQLGAQIISKLSMGPIHRFEIMRREDPSDPRSLELFGYPGFDLEYDDLLSSFNVDLEYDLKGRYLRIGPLVFLNIEAEGTSIAEIREKLGEEFLEKYGGNIIFYVSPDNHWQLRNKDGSHDRHIPFIDFSSISAISGMLKKVYIENKIVADIGSGYGILSLVALRLGAKHVFAVEGEQYCIDKAEEVIRSNGYRTGPGGQVELFHHNIIERSVNLGLPKEAANSVQVIVSNTGPYYGRLSTLIIEQTRTMPCCNQLLITHYELSKYIAGALGLSQTKSFMLQCDFSRITEEFLYFPVTFAWDVDITVLIGERGAL